VDLWSLVWFSFSIHMQAFVIWLAMRDALLTSRKLFVLRSSRGCEMCFFFFLRLGIDDRDHLFFSCGFSAE
jgi:hypothetical protein